MSHDAKVCLASHIRRMRALAGRLGKQRYTAMCVEWHGSVRLLRAAQHRRVADTLCKEQAPGLESLHVNVWRGSFVLHGHLDVVCNRSYTL